MVNTIQKKINQLNALRLKGSDDTTTYFKTQQP
jgi:hypothetical protein